MKVAWLLKYIRCLFSTDLTLVGDWYHQKDFKASLSLNQDTFHSSHKKELKIWEVFINLSCEKKGPATFLTLNG